MSRAARCALTALLVLGLIYIAHEPWRYVHLHLSGRYIPAEGIDCSNSDRRILVKSIDLIDESGLMVYAFPDVINTSDQHRDCRLGWIIPTSNPLFQISDTQKISKGNFADARKDGETNWFSANRVFWRLRTGIPLFRKNLIVCAYIETSVCRSIERRGTSQVLELVFKSDACAINMKRQRAFDYDAFNLNYGSLLLMDFLQLPLRSGSCLLSGVSLPSKFTELFVGRFNLLLGRVSKFGNLSDSSLNILGIARNPPSSDGGKRHDGSADRGNHIESRKFKLGWLLACIGGVILFTSNLWLRLAARDGSGVGYTDRRGFVAIFCFMLGLIVVWQGLTLALPI